MNSDKLSSAGSIRVSLVRDPQKRAYHFHQPVTIGRHLSCDIVIEQEGVSRQHLQLYPESGHWFAADPGSANRVFNNGVEIKKIQIDGTLFVTLGPEGPEIHIIHIPNTEIQPAISDNTHTSEPGYDAFVLQQQKKHRRIITALSALSMLIISGLIVLLYNQQKIIGESNQIADTLYQDIKSLQLQLVTTDANVRKARSVTGAADIRKKRQQMDHIYQRYSAYLSELGKNDSHISAKEQLIIKVAGYFGESERQLPEAFVSEVLHYIEKWQSSGRLNRVINRIEKNGDIELVLDELRDYGLPEQFMYLPLQESNYNHRAIGPETYAGFAKGAWQFIPSTAIEYGLKTGPLAAVSEYDIEDERFDFEKSTKAAVAYIYDIYSTEAQASGLLVLASYNWGHDKVRKLVAKLPDNPRERNFWKLIKDYKIPEETYDYVLMIFSAAVIGENPQLFGFEFERPIS